MKKALNCSYYGRPCRYRTGDYSQALADEATFDHADCIVIGDKKIMEQAIQITKVPLKINTVSKPAEGK